jgi:hypothetical protein
MAAHGDCDAIDLIYDEYVAEEKGKHGTKYEILAAIVFKTLAREHKVVHDLRLSGPGKRTKHQIDVTVERNDAQRLHLIIECRHLFASSRRATIDLDAVRSFASVVRDLQPDQGVMLTTVGYTKAARSYAEDEGIGLGFLRQFRDADWVGRVQEVRVRMEMMAPSDMRITTWLVRDDAERERVGPLLEAEGIDGQTVWAGVNYFYDEDGNETDSWYDVLDPIYRCLQRDLEPGVNLGTELFDDVRWVMLGSV